MLKNIRFIGMRILLATALVLPVAVFGAGKASALEVDHDGSLAAGETVDDDLVIGGEVVEVAGTVNGNLIAGGSRVIISGTVNGDVIAGGSIITISGTVNGNVFAWGNSMVLSGPVSGSAFFGGNLITLEGQAKVGSNLYIGGNMIEIQPGAVISRDAQVGGAQMLMEGEVGRDLNAGLTSLTLTKNAKVGRNVTVEIDAPKKGDQPDQTIMVMPFMNLPGTMTIRSAGLHIESGAQILGKLHYTSSAEQPAGILAKPAGGVEYTYRAPEDASVEGPTGKLDWSVSPAMVFLEWILGIVRDFFTLTVLGLLGIWLIPNAIERCTKALRVKPWDSLGWGFLSLVVAVAALPVLALAIFLLGLSLGLVTLGGLMALIWSLGFSMMGLAYSAFSALAIFGTKVIVSLVVGYLIFRLFKKDYAGSAVWPMLAGIAVFVLLHAIPIFGFLVSLVVITFGLGAVVVALRERWQASHAPVVQ